MAGLDPAIYAPAARAIRITKGTDHRVKPGDDDFIWNTQTHALRCRRSLMSLIRPEKYSGESPLGRRNLGFLTIAALKEQRKTASDNSGRTANTSRKQNNTTNRQHRKAIPQTVAYAGS
jgi:hypothetical protein